KPMAPGFCFTRRETPSFPRPPTPTGQLTDVFTPTLLLNSGDALARKSTQMYVVPDPWARCAAVISLARSDTLSLSFASAGSFHLVILPRKISARTGPLNLSSVVTFGML